MRTREHEDLVSYLFVEEPLNKHAGVDDAKPNGRVKLRRARQQPELKPEQYFHTPYNNSQRIPKPQLLLYKNKPKGRVEEEPTCVATWFVNRQPTRFVTSPASQSAKKRPDKPSAVDVLQFLYSCLGNAVKMRN